MKTPLFQKPIIEPYTTSTTFESETQNFEASSMNREKIGNDLKLQWSQMMQEFDKGAKKQIVSFAPLCSDQPKHQD